MIKLILMCGLPGSGKSKLSALLRTNDNYIIISRDSIRMMMAGTYQNYNFTIENEKFIQNIVVSILDIAILYNKIVIIDETNITKKRRMCWISTVQLLANKYNKEFKSVCILVDTSIDECKKRRLLDTKNTDTDWNIVIDKMVEEFEIPLKEEFDDLIIYNCKGNTHENINS